MEKDEAVNFVSRHKCDQCGKLYKRKYHLQAHLRYECGKEPQFFCPHCPYKAKRNTSLKSHMVFKHREFARTSFKN
ncbi:hypothetical protein J6590_014799 [Homalodisca vitripennis]|nr:hypothetical protein J6590_014799 [Homalodisca vitripennis]